MQIKELSSCKNGEMTTIRAVAANKELKQKNGGGEFLSVELVDATGRIIFPIFDNVNIVYEKLEIGKPYIVEGAVNIWNGSAQLKNPKFRIIKEYDASEFIAKYNVDNTLVEEFLEVIDNLKEPYKTIARESFDLNTTKERWNKFLVCPSAKKFHGNKLGGLFLHTYGVLKNITNMISVYENGNLDYPHVSTVLNKDRLILKAIIHDLMKTEEYVYDTYIDRRDNVIGHIIDGATFITIINSKCDNILSSEELEDIKYSLLSHHGEFGPYEPKTIEDWLLHLADMIDAKVVYELEK